MRDPRQVEHFDSNKRIIDVVENPERMLLEDSVLVDIMRGPVMDGVKKAEARSRAEAVLRIIGIDEEIWNKSPLKISEGEKKLVELAEAIAVKPDTLIIQKPFRSLDAETCERVSTLLNEIQSQGMEIIVNDNAFRPVVDYRHVSGLTKVNPGIKLWFAVVFLTITLISGNWVSILLSVLFAAFCVIAVKTPFRKILEGSSGIIIFIFLLSLIMGFSFSFITAAKFFVKMCAIIIMVNGIFQSTKNVKILDGLTRGFKMSAEMASEVYMLLGFFHEEGMIHEETNRAERLRGMQVETLPWNRKVYWYISGILPRMNLTIETMKRRSKSIKLNKFTSNIRRSKSVKTRMNKETRVVFALLILFSAMQIASMILF